MKFDQEVSTPLANTVKPAIPFSEAERTSPAANPWRNVLTGMVLALGAGLTGFVGAGLICAGFGWPVRVALVVAGLLVICVMLSWLLSAGSYDILYTVERITGADLNHDGNVGRPMPPPSLALEIHPRPNQRLFGSLPGPPDVIQQWAIAATSGGSLAYATWDRRFGEYQDAGGQTVKLYRQFREALVSTRLAAENGQQGLSLTNLGQRVFAELADIDLADATPLLEGRVGACGPSSGINSGLPGPVGGAEHGQ